MINISFDREIREKRVELLAPSPRLHKAKFRSRNQLQTLKKSVILLDQNLAILKIWRSRFKNLRKIWLTLKTKTNTLSLRKSTIANSWQKLINRTIFSLNSQQLHLRRISITSVGVITQSLFERHLRLAFGGLWVTLKIGPTINSCGPNGNRTKSWIRLSHSKKFKTKTRIGAKPTILGAKMVTQCQRNTLIRRATPRKTI